MRSFVIGPYPTGASFLFRGLHLAAAVRCSEGQQALLISHVVEDICIFVARAKCHCRHDLCRSSLSFLTELGSAGECVAT